MEAKLAPTFTSGGHNSRYSRGKKQIKMAIVPSSSGSMGSSSGNATTSHTKFLLH